MPASKGSKKSATRSSASRTKGGKSQAKARSSKKRSGTGLLSKVAKAVGGAAVTVASGAVTGALEGVKEGGRKVTTGAGEENKGKAKSKAKWRKGSQEK